MLSGKGCSKLHDLSKVEDLHFGLTGCDDFTKDLQSQADKSLLKE